MTTTAASVRERQSPKRARYRERPEEARIIDEARSEGAPGRDPYHSTVTPGTEYDVALPVGVHRGLGGLHDAPNSGELLCAALASCQDTTIRMVADLFGVEIHSLAVSVEGDVDLRGPLQMPGDVRVGFTDMRCHVDIEVDPATDPDWVEQMLQAARTSCVVADTLREGVPVETTISRDAGATDRRA